MISKEFAMSRPPDEGTTPPNRRVGGLDDCVHARKSASERVRNLIYRSREARFSETSLRRSLEEVCLPKVIYLNLPGTCAGNGSIKVNHCYLNGLHKISDVSPCHAYSSTGVLGSCFRNLNELDSSVNEPRHCQQETSREIDTQTLYCDECKRKSPVFLSLTGQISD